MPAAASPLPGSYHWGRAAAPTARLSAAQRHGISSTTLSPAHPTAGVCDQADDAALSASTVGGHGIRRTRGVVNDKAPQVARYKQCDRTCGPASGMFWRDTFDRVVPDRFTPFVDDTTVLVAETMRSIVSLGSFPHPSPFSISCVTIRGCVSAVPHIFIFFFLLRLLLSLCSGPSRLPQIICR